MESGLMGGNAFPHLNLTRIKKQDISATTHFIVDTLQLNGFTYDYAMSALMGSSGKRETSGDLDYCMNTHTARFVGEPNLPVFDKYQVLDRIRTVLTSDFVNSKTFKMGNLMTAWPIAGDPSNGYIQVDFVFGKFETLQFTHYSPNQDESEFKGVFLSQAMGVLAKMKKDWEAHDPQTGERVARVGLHLSLELGLFRKWEVRKRPGMGASKCDPDEFETRFADAPRFTRLGYVESPQEIVRMLFGPNVQVEDINTFEKFVEVLRNQMPERYGEFWERFLESAGGSQISKANNYDPVWLANHPVWCAKQWQEKFND